MILKEITTSLASLVAYAVVLLRTHSSFPTAFSHLMALGGAHHPIKRGKSTKTSLQTRKCRHLQNMGSLPALHNSSLSNRAQNLLYFRLTITATTSLDGGLSLQVAYVDKTNSIPSAASSMLILVLFVVGEALVNFRLPRG